MEVRDLKNYGKSMSEMLMDVPDDVEKKLQSIGKRKVTKELGLLNLIRFLFLRRKEKARMSKVDLSAVREKGMRDEAFIGSQIEWAAMFSALSKLLGSERAIEILNGVMEATSPQAFVYMMPTVEDLKRFDDPFKAFREYERAGPEAARRTGCHDIEIVEDTDDAFQTDITYCVWHEIARTLGVEEACQPNCYSDDVFLPGYLEQLGIVFKRTSTLARGGARCDFRFERVKG
jgi:hypothetical protein